MLALTAAAVATRHSTDSALEMQGTKRYSWTEDVGS